MKSQYQEDLLRKSKEIFESAVKIYKPKAIVGMLSGGDDSMTMMEVAKAIGIKFNYVVHGYTRTGIPETTKFAVNEIERRGHRLLLADAGDSYVNYVMRKGFFGKGVGHHNISYHILKLGHFRRVVSHNIRMGRRNYPILFIGGARRSESPRRKVGLISPYRVIDDGRNIWVSLINDWDKQDCLDFLEGNGVFRNPVSIKLCRSGECMCGTMQSEGDRNEAAFFYPDWGKNLDALDKIVKAKHGWGWNDQGPSKNKTVADYQAQQQFQPMCTGCKINYEAFFKMDLPK